VAICPECGEYNRFDGAASCRKCGSSLGGNAESKTSDDKLSRDHRDERDSARPSENDSHPKSETSDFEYTVEEDLIETDSIKSKPAFDESESEGIESSSTENSTAGDSDMFEGTNEIDLPDQADDAEVGSESEQRSESAPVQHDAVSNDDKKELLESLRSKIPSMIDGNNHPKAPERKQEPRRHPADTSSDNRNVETGSQENPEQVTTSGDPDSHSPQPKSANENRIVQFSGSRLHFHRTTKFSAGEHVVFRNTTYNLQPRKRDRKTLTLIGALAAVVILVFVSGIVKSGPGMITASLVGVVVDESTHQVLTDVKITILETGKSVTTNQDGMFIFEMVPEGTYTIGAETPFFETAHATVQHGNDRNSLIAIDMRGSDHAEITDKTTVGQNVVEESTQKKNVARYGILDITMEFAEAEIFLDNQSYGTGARKIKKVREGKHKLVVKLDGYQTFEKTVRIKRNETTKVTAELAQIPKDSPSEPTAADYIRAGDEAVATHSFYAAIADYNEALKLDRNASTYMKRAVAFRAAGHAAEAIEDFIKAGRMYTSVGQISSAISAFSDALDLNPDHLQALRARGYAHIQRGEYELALADFKTACDENKNVYESFIGLGDAYSVLGKYKDAIKSYKNAEKLTDDKADVYALIALASLSRGKDKDARKYYRKFVEAANPDTEQKYARDPEWQRLKQLASKN
jgi:tetratricopeptide (TPR) repeat protein